MSTEEQIQLLANYIMAEIEGETSCSEGIGNMAIRLLRRYRLAFGRIIQELGIPQPSYPMPVANAYEIARVALIAEMVHDEESEV